MELQNNIWYGADQMLCMHMENTFNETIGQHCLEFSSAIDNVL